MSTPDYTCPNCGGHRFDLVARQVATVLFEEDGDHNVEDVGGDVEWDDDTIATCCGCNYSAPLGEME